MRRYIHTSSSNSTRLGSTGSARMTVRMYSLTLSTEPIAAAVTEDPASTEQRAAYEKALALQRDAEADPDDYARYLSAAEAFEALGAYKDSADRAAQCRDQLVLLNEAALQEDYAAAQELLTQRRYSEAREAFLALGDYEDSAELANESLYQKALCPVPSS